MRSLFDWYDSLINIYLISFNYFSPHSDWSSRGSKSERSHES